MEAITTYINEFSAEKQPLVVTYPYSVPIVTISGYLLFVFLGPKVMENYNEIKIFNKILPYWNLFLSIASVVMFMGMAPICAQYILQYGYFKFLCMPTGDLYAGSQMFWAYFFLMSKFVELLDTFFLVVRKRRVDFLHYYHHTTVLLYTWFCLVILPGGVSYFFSIVNCAVHTLMYFYYFLSSFQKPSWGVIVTNLQLLQMVVGVIIAFSWVVMYFTSGYCTCSVPYIFILCSVGLYGTYFLLFLNFYRKKYTPPPSKRTPSSKRE